MWVQSLSLTDFRSYARVELELSLGVNTFVGRNGQGKTNLIEAVGYVSALSSHRVAGDLPLVRKGADMGLITCGIRTDDRDVVIDIAILPGRANKARINRSPLPRVRDILGHLRTVLFAPEDLSLVKGDPAERRAFIDDLLVQRNPRLAATRSDYDRILKQRNALLKSAFASRRRGDDNLLSTLDVWDGQLVAAGSALIAARVGLIDDLRSPAAAEYRQLSGDDSSDLTLGYLTSIGPDTEITADAEAWARQFGEALTRRRQEELDRGLTLLGPHRDDIVLGLDGIPAKGYASHGESWSIALALRLASFDVLVGDGVEPVLILDDVFAELDSTRRALLGARVQAAAQVLITAAAEEDVPVDLRGVTFRVSPLGVERA